MVYKIKNCTDKTHSNSYMYMHILISYSLVTNGIVLHVMTFAANGLLDVLLRDAIVTNSFWCYLNCTNNLVTSYAYREIHV